MPNDEIVLEDDAMPLSTYVRKATRPDHEAAEESSFVGTLIAGAIPRESYILFVRQLEAVYDSLERAAARMADDAVAGPFVFAELTRLPELHADLVFLAGDHWRKRFPVLDATAEYAARIDEVGATPEGFIAHHYTRYLGDLSGGQMLRTVVAKTYNLDADGLRFYDFAQITDPKAFKGQYRARLDNLAFDAATRERFVDEVSRTYRYNSGVFGALATALV